MCSLRPMVLYPTLMACRMTSSSWSLAWPGQNWPEWECIVKAILGVVQLTPVSQQGGGMSSEILSRGQELKMR